MQMQAFVTHNYNWNSIGIFKEIGKVDFYKLIECVDQVSSLFFWHKIMKII